MDLSTHRAYVAHLCEQVRARALSVRYRLAPQNPFPAVLVDLLVEHLSLVSPHPGSLHKPVPTSKSVIGGDSAEASLSLALLVTLLTLQRRGTHSIRFHGQEVRIELPAGLAGVSPWCDVTRSMLSVFSNAQYDYIPPPFERPDVQFHPLTLPPDHLWPCSALRTDTYANGNSVVHPMVSPIATTKELWEGAPPVYFNVGEESH